MEFLQIEAERVLALQQQSLSQRVGRHEGVAIAVAADPAPHAQEGGNFHRSPGGIHGCELIFQGGINPRQLLEEGVVVIGEAVHDLVNHLEPVTPQDARLPESENGAAKSLLAGYFLLWGEM